MISFQIEDEATKLKKTYGEKPVVEVEGPSMLGCEGVFYKCPLILGPDKVQPRKKIQQSIRDFLYQQLNTDDRGLTACLIIHTLTKDPAKVIINGTLIFGWPGLE